MLTDARAVSEAHFQHSDLLPIVLDDLYCLGSENRLVDCGSREHGLHNCRQREAAGVVCRREYIQVFICMVSDMFLMTTF